MKVNSYKDLIVWQKSFRLAKEVYSLTKSLPKSEQYGLASQLQRCAVSIPSNIAEGQQRNNLKEYKQFIGIAKGSAAELETQLMLIAEVYDLDTKILLDLLEEIQKMLNVMNKKLKPST